jgi:hypothetical protein
MFGPSGAVAQVIPNPKLWLANSGRALPSAGSAAETGKGSPVSQNDRELLQNFLPKLFRRNLDVFC